MALITRAEAKTHLNLSDDITIFDDFIDAAILAAIQFVEAYTCQTINQIGADSPPVYATQNFGSWGYYLEVEKTPILSIQSVAYVDNDGNQQTWSSSLWELDSNKLFGRIYPVYGESFPTARVQRNAITVTYDAGRLTMPADMKQATLMVIASMFINRENDAALTLKTVPLSAERLLAAYKIRKV